MEFIKNKWYTYTINNNKYYWKLLEYNESYLKFSERIFGNIYYYTENDFISNKDFWNCELANLSEIQEYLPDGHIDKLNTITEPINYDYLIPILNKIK